MAIRFDLQAPGNALVLNLEMAALAFYLMLGDMIFVNKMRILVALQAILLEMTIHAVLKRHCTVTNHHLSMTLLAGNTSFNDQGMIVAYLATWCLHRRVMAAYATGRGFGLPPFEVAKEAGGFSNRDMLTLNNLRVTASAAQMFAPPEFGEMWSVVENYLLFELYFAFQHALIMTTPPQAACIRNLRPGL